MSFKKIIHEKIPEGIHKTHEFNVLLSIVKEKKLKDVLELLAHLDLEIRRYRKDLLDSSANTLRINDARWLDSLEKIRLLAEEYLRY